MKNSILYYSVGALLYCPANRENIADSLTQGKFGEGYSLALCLEDTIADGFVAQAQTALIRSLQQVYENRQSHSFFMPKIFIRVRNAAQIPLLVKRLGDAREILFGFIIPKFDLENADGYLDAVTNCNGNFSKKLYLMPIMESHDMIDLRKRAPMLYGLKERLAPIEELVLNIRVGGNDLCHAFGFRRRPNEPIHRILPVANIFSDIITVFGMDYVVSGPVYEYYGGDGWDKGLRQELAGDKLTGFIGKTVIHPKQIPLVQEAYAVSQEDLSDAKAILGWSDSASYVSGNVTKQRMNEYKTHCNWAKKILYLSGVYGTTMCQPSS